MKIPILYSIIFCGCGSWCSLMAREVISINNEVPYLIIRVKETGLTFISFNNSIYQIELTSKVMGDEKIEHLLGKVLSVTGKFIDLDHDGTIEEFEIGVVGKTLDLGQKETSRNKIMLESDVYYHVIPTAKD